MKDGLAHLDDAALFALIRSDKATSDAAFRELYSRHSPRVHEYCSRICKSRDEAEDLFQEAFVRFYHSASQERVMTNVPAFLLRIARNCAIDQQRRRKPDFTFDETLGGGDPLTKSYEQKELMDLLQGALAKLDFEYREAFVLRMEQGLDYDEISSITGDTVNAVRNRVWRAKDKLRALLAPYLDELSRL